jgi:hypothetical protein
VGVSVLDHEEPALALVRLGWTSERRGGVLQFYASGGQEEVVTEAVRAPLFPVLLAASVVAFGTGNVTVVAVNDGALGPRSRALPYEAAREAARGDWRRAQLPLVLPSLLASLGAIALAFRAARRGSSLAAAATGALALATAPVEVWCAHRVTPDTLTELTCGLAAVLAAEALGRAGVGRAFAAGLAGGAVILTKAVGLLTLPAYLLAELALLAAIRTRSRADLAAAARRTTAFAAGFLLGGAFWPLTVYLKTGDLRRALGVGSERLPSRIVESPWIVLTQQRPFWSVPATNGALAPLLVGAGAAALAVLASRLVARGVAREDVFRASRWIGLAAYAALFFAITCIHVSRESRYLLPAYVPLAVGVAGAVDGGLGLLRARLGERGARLAVVLVVAPALALATVRARHVGPSGAWELQAME